MLREGERERESTSVILSNTENRRDRIPIYTSDSVCTRRTNEAILATLPAPPKTPYPPTTVDSSDENPFANPLYSLIQLLARFRQNPRHLLDLFLRKCPITFIDRITDPREIGFVIAGPGLWGENYVFELFAAGELDMESG